MKLPCHPFLRIAASLAFGMAPAAYAQVVNIDNQTLHYGTLLTDNFNTASYNWWEFNNSIAADQGGTLATVAYYTSDGNGYTAQHSNGGNMLLTSDGWWGWGGMASPNHNFATTANTTNKPLEIQFDMSSTAGDAPDWIGFGLNSGQGQLFYEGAYGFAATVGDGIHNYKLVISDAAGTGSGFNGITDGAKIEFYKDNVWQQTITETLGTSDGYITFRTIPSQWTGWNIGVVDNLKITNGQQINPLATSTELNLSNNGIVKFGDVTQTVAKLDGTSGTQVNLVPVSGTSSLTVNGASDSSFAGVISGSGGSLTKAGSGTLTLSGANGYTGATIIKAGTLAVGSSGSIAASASIVVGDAGSSGAVLDVSAHTGGFTIGSGQTLSGIGTIDANDGVLKYTVSIDGTHNPGNSPGIQTVDGNLSYGATSIFNWELTSNTSTQGGAPNYTFDQVAVTGTLNFASGAKINLDFDTGVDFSDAFWSSNQSWAIFTGATSVTGSFAINNISLDSTSTPYTTNHPNGYFTINGSSLNWTAVPELSNVLIGGLLGTGLLRRRRRE